MEIILWIIGAILGLLVLRFLFIFIFQLIGLGVGLALMSFFVCGALTLFDVMEWETCLSITKWAFYIGTAIGVIVFISNPGEGLSQAFHMFQDDLKSKPKEPDTSWKERYSFYDENGYYTEVESDSKYCPDDFRDPITSERWKRDSATGRFEKLS